MTKERGIVIGKTTVMINNNLQASTILTVHCKSKDDDVGIHYIRESYFSWPARFEWFDIYKANRDWCCCELCIWNISPNGPCILSESGKYDICYPWNLHLV
ncbi:hypothetical protein BT93_G0069 [Corymbia citriodora subsp. variegata]|nr:hypothetical protein BT93_G0069 [Corymbia citriodora subsp. variegata]